MKTTVYPGWIAVFFPSFTIDGEHAIRLKDRYTASNGKYLLTVWTKFPKNLIKTYGEFANEIFVDRKKRPFGHKVRRGSTFHHDYFWIKDNKKC